MKQSNERLSFSVFSKTLRHPAPLWWAYWIKAPAAVMENESGAVAYAPAPREKQEKWKSPPVLLGSIFIGRKPDFRSVTLDLQQTPTAHRGRQACRHWVSFLYFFLSICSCMLCFISPSLYLCCLAFCFCPYLPPALIDIPPSKHGESALSSSRKKKRKNLSSYFVDCLKVSFSSAVRSFQAWNFVESKGIFWSQCNDTQWSSYLWNKIASCTAFTKRCLFMLMYND